jgi:hypothetical protein
VWLPDSCPSFFVVFLPTILNSSAPQRAGQHALTYRQMTFGLTPFQRQLNGGFQQYRMRYNLINQTRFQRLTRTKLLPVKIISSAVLTPTSRGKRCVPPEPGSSPSCTSGKPKTVFASSVHIRL